MENDSQREVWVTVTYDRYGSVIDVRDRKGQLREPRFYGEGPPEPKVGNKCPEGEVEITAVKTIEIQYVTCANVNDPCWVYNPATRKWTYTC